MRMKKIIKLSKFLPTLTLMVASLSLSACSSLMSDVEIDALFQRAGTELRGKTAADIIACAGLPDTSVDLEEGRQVLGYQNVTTRIEREFYPYHYATCGWPYYGYRCYHDTGALSHMDRFDVKQRACRVGVWLDKGKVQEISIEASSKGARWLCRDIINACLSQPSDDSQQSAPSPANQGKAS